MFETFEEVTKNESEHIRSFVNGFESITQQFRCGDKMEIGGCEAYAVGVFSASGMPTIPAQGGFENFVVNGIKKLYEMVKTFLAGVWNFFFGKTRWGIETKNNIKLAEGNFVRLKKTDNPEMNKLREIYYPLAKDFTNIDAIITAMDDTAEKYKKVFGKEISTKSEFEKFKTLLKRVSEEMLDNVNGEVKDTWLKSLTITWFNQSGELCTHYDTILKEMKRVMDSAELAALTKEGYECNKADATKLMNLIKKVIDLTAQKFTKLAKAFVAAEKVKESK